MKKIVSTLCISFLYTTFASATIGGNGNGSSRNMNFYGTLHTHSNKTYKVDNITIEKKHTKLHAYEKPAIETKGKSEVLLESNPASESAVSILELQEIKSISVPEPQTKWIFQRESRKRKYKFLEIEVTSNSGTTRNYLLEKRTTIHCNEIDAAGPIEKEVPLAAIKTLTIDGYEVNDIKKK